MGLLGMVRRAAFRRDSTSYFWSLRGRAASTTFAPLRLYYRWRYRGHMRKFGCSIPLTTRFDGVPTFPHGLYGIFISQAAHIGKDVVIFHHVTIGSNTLNDTKGGGAPTIGDNAFVGAGAKIIGGVTVGKGARVGANAVVVKDLPDYATLVLSEPRVILHESRENRFRSYTDFADTN